MVQSDLSLIAFVVGMRSEAALLPAGARVLVSGGRPEKARALAERALAEGARGLISFGVAGALSPSAACGQVIVATAVALEDGRVLEADDGWCRRLLAAVPGAVGGPVFGATRVADSAEAKRALHRQSHALAVDMESGEVAQACAAAGKPFAVLRAVGDPAERAIPALAMAGLGPDGETRPFAVAAGLLRRPQDLPALIRLGKDTSRALRALGEAVKNSGQLLSELP